MGKPSKTGHRAGKGKSSLNVANNLNKAAADEAEDIDAKSVGKDDGKGNCVDVEDDDGQEDDEAEWNRLAEAQNAKGKSKGFPKGKNKDWRFGDRIADDYDEDDEDESEDEDQEEDDEEEEEEPSVNNTDEEGDHTEKSGVEDDDEEWNRLAQAQVEEAERMGERKGKGKGFHDNNVDDNGDEAGESPADDEEEVDEAEWTRLAEAQVANCKRKGATKGNGKGSSGNNHEDDSDVDDDCSDVQQEEDEEEEDEDGRNSEEQEHESDEHEEDEEAEWARLAEAQIIKGKNKGAYKGKSKGSVNQHKNDEKEDEGEIDVAQPVNAPRDKGSISQLGKAKGKVTAGLERKPNDGSNHASKVRRDTGPEMMSAKGKPKGKQKGYPSSYKGGKAVGKDRA